MWAFSGCPAATLAENRCTSSIGSLSVPYRATARYWSCNFSQHSFIVSALHCLVSSISLWTALHQLLQSGAQQASCIQRMCGYKTPQGATVRLALRAVNGATRAHSAATSHLTWGAPGPYPPPPARGSPAPLWTPPTTAYSCAPSPPTALRPCWRCQPRGNLAANAMAATVIADPGPDR